MVYLFGFIQLLGFQNYYNHKMQRCILRKRCFEKMQLINRRTLITGGHPYRSVISIKLPATLLYTYFRMGALL